MTLLKDLETDTIQFHVAVFLVVVLVVWFMLHMNSVVFRKLKKEKKGLHLVFFERINAVVLVLGGLIISLSLFAGVGNLWRALLGGTAVVSAVVAIAAQDVIDDVLAGMMISIYKPFELGNRIELEDGTAGIVKDITMRHVVIHTPWSEAVIPNSQLNKMKILNYSYHMEARSFLATFHVSYGTDVDQAIHVVREAVINCEDSIPGLKTENGMQYAPVYFMAYEDSSLRLETRVFFQADVPSEKVISEVNLAVNKALRAARIEIPYPYVNVVRQ